MIKAKPANGSNVQIRKFLRIGNWQSDANSICEEFRASYMNRQQANGSQMPIRIFLCIGNWQLAVSQFDLRQL